MAARARSGHLRGPGALILALVVVALLPAAASANVIRVTTTADGAVSDSDCTLREAVLAANSDAAQLGCTSGQGNDTILLTAGTFKLTLAPQPGDPDFNAHRGSLDVYDPDGQALTITPYIGRAVIDGNGSDRVFTARSPLTLSRLTVTGGDSSASLEATGLGGGVAALSQAPVSLRSATLTDNSASLAGGAVHATGALEVSQSTISGNRVESTEAGSGGGGLDVQGTLTVGRSTIAENTVASGDNLGSGGGIRYAGNFFLAGSIIAGNAADGGSQGCHAEGGSAAGDSLGFNVVVSAAGCGLTLEGTDTTADPGLLPLADNGGPADTHRIPAGSSAADRGPAAAAPGCAGATDQRGALRDYGGACDAGAYELYPCGNEVANVIGGPGPDLLGPDKPVVAALGFGGDDTIAGGNGNDSLCGNAGSDTLDGRGGADVLIGGPDVDIASYATATTPVSVTLDNLPNDGRAGEGDLVLTESVIGGTAADSITGDNANNGVQGRAGNDTLRGLGGNDSLVGQDGNDTIDGGDGNDELRGGAGNDKVLGGKGNDRLDGEAGNDKLDGGKGNDRLFGRGGKNTLLGGSGNDVITGGRGKDKIRCGKGRDKVVASKKAKVARDCEKVARKRRPR